MMGLFFHWNSKKSDKSEVLKTNKQKSPKKKYIKLALASLALCHVAGIIMVKTTEWFSIDSTHPICFGLGAFVVFPLLLGFLGFLGKAFKVDYPKFGFVISLLVKILLVLSIIVGILDILYFFFA